MIFMSCRRHFMFNEWKNQSQWSWITGKKGKKWLTRLPTLQLLFFINYFINWAMKKKNTFSKNTLISFHDTTSVPILNIQHLIKSSFADKCLNRSKVLHDQWSISKFWTSLVFIRCVDLLCHGIKSIFFLQN